MTAARLWVPEYGKIFKGTSNRELGDGNLVLSATDFEAVLSLLEESDTRGLSSVFWFCKYNGTDCLRVQNYVGVIRTESDCQIEIVPKISKSSVHPARAQALLIKMLEAMSDTPFKLGTIADLYAHKMPLLEMVLRYFLRQVADIVRQGIARSYVDSRDNLVFLRGKLQLSQHLKQNLFKRNRFYCEFDEFEANRPINRLIKRALEIVHRESRDVRNIQQCRELMYWFDRVPSSTDIALDFRSMRQDRLVQHYSPAMPTCRLILEGLNPLTQGGKNRTVSMLFDMNTLFQDYVVAKMSIQFPDWQVNAQQKKFHLVNSFQGKPHFGLVPDVEFTHCRSDLRVIADCKWKLIDVAKSDHGISQSDMYQLFAYCKKCIPNQDNRCVLLIYPKTDEFRSPLGPFYFDKQRKHRLFALPFDLIDDCLIMNHWELHDKELIQLVA